MSVYRPTLPGRRGRIAELFALAFGLVACFAAGVWIGPRINARYGSPQDTPPAPAPAAPVAGAAAIVEAANTAQPPDLVQPTDPRQSEPRAVEARTAAIRSAAAEIQAECQRAAAGDWDKWERDTEPYRVSLKKRVDAAKDIPGATAPFPECQQEPLEGLKGFPLFEPGPREHLNYLYNAAKLEEFRHDRPAVAADRWLRKQGIDLIFVPVPKMTEVYIDHFIEPCPADGIIAPHIRKTLLDLLKEDVEVVDGLPLYRAVRDMDAEYLYNAADTHWAPRGMRVMAKEIASRIERYKFGARARYGLPIVRAKTGVYLVEDLVGRVGGNNHWSLLTRPQRKLAATAQAMTQAEVRMMDGKPPPDDPNSPVLIIGHSYVPNFREQLIRELNLLTCNRDQKGQTTQAFADFLREPEQLAHCRVVVWITTEQHLTRFAKMPEPVLKVLEAGK